MPSGGRRQGAGRKPKAGILLGMDGSRRSQWALSPAPDLEELQILREPPFGLSPEAAICWRELAPKALERRTLTSVEVAGFTELCIRLSRVRALDARIDQLGTATKEALPYLRERRGCAQLLNASLKDFKLTAFGKPVVAEAVKTEVNPFAALGAVK